MKTLKNVRALAASLGVLAMGAVAVSPAMAFDNVEWNWKNDTKQHTDVDVDVDVNVDSTGLVQIEKLQIFLGNVKAESIVKDISNNPGSTGDQGPGPKGYGIMGGEPVQPNVMEILGQSSRGINGTMESVLSHRYRSEG